MPAATKWTAHAGWVIALVSVSFGAVSWLNSQLSDANGKISQLQAQATIIPGNRNREVDAMRESQRNVDIAQDRQIDQLWAAVRACK